MSTAVASFPTRQEIFRRGLHNAMGTVTWINPVKPNEGTVTLDGPVRIEFHFHRKEFVPEQRNLIGVGSRVIFRMAAGLQDSLRPKPKMTLPHLLQLEDLDPYSPGFIR